MSIRNWRSHGEVPEFKIVIKERIGEPYFDVNLRGLYKDGTILNASSSIPVIEFVDEKYFFEQLSHSIGMVIESMRNKRDGTQ